MGTAYAAQEAAQPAAAAVPAQTLPASTDRATSPDRPDNPDKESASRPAGNLQPNNDKLDDYRYCLELKTNLEIANCRYKK